MKKYGEKLQQNRREREMKPEKETEKTEAETIRKRKPSFFTINGDTPITLLALLGVFFLKN